MLQNSTIITLTTTGSHGIQKYPEILLMNNQR
nr:MAG TPA: hypothetical protein [Bacteriophage sp.]